MTPPFSPQTVPIGQGGEAGPGENESPAEESFAGESSEPPGTAEDEPFPSPPPVLFPPRGGVNRPPPYQPPSPVGRRPGAPPSAGEGGRQPGAPAVPFTPPGRIGLWGGPSFGSGSSGSTAFTTAQGATVEGGGIGGSPVFVNVDQSVSLADNSAANAVQNVADAVSSALNQSAQIAANTAGSLGQLILGSIDTQTGLITQDVGAAFTSLAGALNDIVNSVGIDLSGIGAVIGNQLTNLIDPITAVISVILGQINRNLSNLGVSIAQAVAAVIPAIIRAVEDPIGAVTGALRQVEADIGQNLASLVQIPGAIAEASTSLDATLGRILGSWESFTESQTGYPDGGNTHKDLKGIIDAIAGLTSVFLGKASVTLKDTITTNCAGRDLDALLNKPWIPPDDSHGYLYDVWYMFSKLLTSVLTWAASIYPAVQKVTEEASQKLNEACPIDLLPVTALVDAELRGFLTREQTAAEAAKSNLSESRYQVLKDLATHQMSPAQLVEALYRGIVTQGDYAQALAAQGWTAGQQAILTGLGVSLLTVSEGLELRRRSAIDAPTLDAVLKSRAYDDTQRKLLASLAFRPANANEAQEWGAASEAFGFLGTTTNVGNFPAPEYFEVAAAAEGLDSDATAKRWLSHWNIGSFGTWVELFFRGRATIEGVQAAASKAFIPQELVLPFIEAQRPLVQFRTISTALRLNLISEAQARLLLGQHGYSSENIDVLIKYAQRPGPTHPTKNAPALHQTSLAIAKQEYIDGSIDRSQLAAILTQHGYTVDGANTELDVIDAHQALLRRKASAQLVIDEYGAGLIDEQTALAQLATQGLTVGELAHAAHRIRAFRAGAAKHPTESELNHFLQKSLISADEYVAELTSQHYSKKWAQTFLAWRQSPGGASTSSAAGASAFAPGG